MYLYNAVIENSGAITHLEISLPFDDAGRPQPLVFVGENGSGKTNVLSIIADALFEGAAVTYIDVVGGSSGLHRPWFRLAGSSTIRHGSEGEFAILRFKHAEQTYFYTEKSGQYDVEQARQKTPEDLKPAVNWSNGPQRDAVKTFSLQGEQARTIYEEGAYVYFPSSRAELPYWLNEAGLPVSAFDTSPRFSQHLRKPIYVERSIRQFEQWLLSVLVDSRMDFLPAMTGDPPSLQLIPRGDVAQALGALSILEASNKILRLILNDPTARFGWAGRLHDRKLAIGCKGQSVLPSLDNLSAGQSTLLGIFGSILRYGDYPRLGGHLSLPEITGICIVDEIDAHMHIDLQFRALPELMKLFPKVQFILSSHSPLFVVGMERAYSEKGMYIVEMPGGLRISGEAYAEFAKALEIVKHSRAFTETVAEQIKSASGKCLVLTEGETDPMYLKTAATVLDHGGILEAFEFQWIGIKDGAGRVSNTGKSALNAADIFLRSNPSVMTRPVLLLYDNDAGRPSERAGNLFIETIKTNDANTVVKSGIENLLPANVFTDDLYVVREEGSRANGDRVKVERLDKVSLAKRLCGEGADPQVFDGFRPLLARLNEIAAIQRG